MTMIHVKCIIVDIIYTLIYWLKLMVTEEALTKSLMTYLWTRKRNEE